MFKDEILESERRRKIYDVVEASPGIHLRELQRMMDIPLTSLEYHLTYMTHKGILFAETEGYLKRYYTKPLDPEDKKVLSALRQKRMREIVLTVLENGKAKNQLLAERLKLSHSTLSSYLKYLVNKNILAREKVGYEYLYIVRDEDRVAKVLIAYKPSFLDKLVDRVLDTWMETHYPKAESRAARTVSRKSEFTRNFSFFVLTKKGENWKSFVCSSDYGKTSYRRIISLSSWSTMWQCQT